MRGDLGRSHLLRNSDGYTLIEALIGALLLGFVAIAAGSAVKTIFSGVGSNVGKNNHTLMRAQIIQTLMNSSTCAGSINVPAPVQSGSAIQSISAPSGGTLFNYNDGTNGVVDGIQYVATLQLPPSPNGVFTAGNGRPNPTNWYLGSILLTGVQQNQNSKSKSPRSFLGPGSFSAQIPISLEIDQVTNALASCTVNPADPDEMLMRGQHTVRDCIANGGSPFPSDIGMQCRFPLGGSYANSSADCSNPPPVTIPSCGNMPTLGLPPGNHWTDTNYNTTVGSSIGYQTCQGGMTQQTGYHEFSLWTKPVENANFTPMAGSGSSSSYAWLAGGTTALAFGLAAGPIGVLVGILIFIIFSISSGGGCTNGPPTYCIYAQPIAIGCY